MKPVDNVAMTLTLFKATCFIASLCLAAFGTEAVASSQAAPGCKSTVVGDLQTRSFKSSIFADAQTLRIWLPPGYNDQANAQRHYPVLYMLDGENLFDICTSGFQQEWRIDETLTRLIAEGSVEPLIVVGIDSPGKRRADEYLPYADPLFPAFPEPHGSLFPASLATEVLPLVSHEFRVSNDPQHTAVGGSSYGAVAALYTLVRRPDLFGMGLLESTSLHTGNGQLLRDVTPLVIGPRKVYIGVGTDEVVGHEQLAQERALEVDTVDRGAVHLAEMLAADLRASVMNHPEVLFVKQPGAKHEEKAWAERFPAAIKISFSSAAYAIVRQSETLLCLHRFRPKRRKGPRQSLPRAHQRPPSDPFQLRVAEPIPTPHRPSLIGRKDRRQLPLRAPAISLHRLAKPTSRQSREPAPTA